jgi:hypothetical protein
VFGVTVGDHMMIAHSITGAVFGPAQRLHGATYVLDATFRRAAPDDDPDLAGTNTTTGTLARVIADRLTLRIRDGALGPGGDGLEALAVTLHESPVASASYDCLL